MTEPKVTKRQVYGSNVTSYTLNAPEYSHNQQHETSNPVVQPLREMTLNGYQDVEEEPKKKRARRKKKPVVEVDLDAVQDIVEQDLVKRGYKQPLPKEE